MPYTKVLFLFKWSVIERLKKYLQNQDHPNHLDYTTESFQSTHPALSPDEFFPVVRDAIDRLRQMKRGGRPVKNLVALHISRTADGTHLDAQERSEYASRYVQYVAPDRLALYSWHVNLFTGSADLNVFVPNVQNLSRPRVRRTSQSNPIKDAREAADRVTEELNRKRSKKKDR